MGMFMNGSHWCLLLGGLALAKGLFCMVAPSTAAAMARKFPRQLIVGRVLAAVAWTWAGYAVWQMGLDFLGPFMKALPVVVVAGAILSWFWMPDLLSCRAAAAIAMLLPMPLILAVRAEPSLWRLVPVSLGYLCAVGGMDVMLYPWHHRDLLFWLAAKPGRMRIAGALMLLAAATLFLAARHLS